MESSEEVPSFGSDLAENDFAGGDSLAEVGDQKEEIASSTRVSFQRMVV